MITREKNRD